MIEALIIFGLLMIWLLWCNYRTMQQRQQRWDDIHEMYKVKAGETNAQAWERIFKHYDALVQVRRVSYYTHLWMLLTFRDANTLYGDKK